MSDRNKLEKRNMAKKQEKTGMTQNTKKTKKQTAAKTQIPAADRTEGTGLSAADMLSSLAGKASKSKKKSGAARPELSLSAEAQEAFREFAPAKELADHFKGYFEQTKGEFNELAWKEFIAFMWSAKTQPKNPSISVKGSADGGGDPNKPDCTGQFVVVAKFKVQAEAAEEAVQILVDQGLAQDDAERLVDEELNFTPMLSVRNFNHLVDGRRGDGGWIEATEDEKAVAKKLMGILQSDEFSDEERELLITNQPNIEIKDGFLQRACSYAHSEEQLGAVLDVIKPQVQNRQVKFAVSDSIDGGNTRKIEEAAKILGVALGVE